MEKYTFTRKRGRIDFTEDGPLREVMPDIDSSMNGDRVQAELVDEAQRELCRRITDTMLQYKICHEDARKHVFERAPLLAKLAFTRRTHSTRLARVSLEDVE